MRIRLTEESQVLAVQRAYVGRFEKPFQFQGKEWATQWISYSVPDSDESTDFAKLVMVRKAEIDEKPKFGEYVAREGETLMIEWPSRWSFPESDTDILSRLQGSNVQVKTRERKDDGATITSAAAPTQARLDF